jgi:hypothetical protein
MKTTIYCRIRLLGYIVLLFLLLAPQAWAATYYVDATNGSDSRTGLSEITAWKSIAKVNSSRFQPGDQILFKRGKVWREQLTIPSSGASGRPITFGAYGVGNSPTINGSDVVSGWSVYRGTTFKASGLTFQANQVFMDSTRLTKGPSPDTLNNQEWCWASGVLYLRNDTGNPSGIGKLIEASQRDYCVLVDYPGAKNFIVIDGLLIEKANSIGIFVASALIGFTISNSITQFCYFDGFKATGNPGQNNGFITGNIIRLNGRSGINITGMADSWIIDGNKCSDNCQVNDAQHDFCGGVYIWGDNSKAPNLITNMVVQYNEIYRNGITSPTENRGTGIWLDDCGVGNIVRYNSVYSNNSNGIFLEATSNARVYYNLVYANNGATQWTCAGIYIKGNDGRLASNNFVSNNTVYNNWAGIGVQTFGENSRVANNLVINNISVGNVKNLYADLGGDNDGIYGSGNVYQHNCFGPERAGFIKWGKADYSYYAQWESACGGPTYSIKADPQFVNTSTTDFHLLSSSPCIRAGANVGLKNDFWGSPLPVGQDPDVGAAQFEDGKPIPPRNLRVTSF